MSNFKICVGCFFGGEIEPGTFHSDDDAANPSDASSPDSETPEDQRGD